MATHMSEISFAPMPEKAVKRIPKNDTGIYLYQHTHNWEEIGAHKWPNGEWDPVFKCQICDNVICAKAIEVPA